MDTSLSKSTNSNTRLKEYLTGDHGLHEIKERVRL